MTGAITGAAVELSGLSKRFGRVQALDDVTLTPATGKVTAILGPNAAGKSTLIRILLGLTQPDAGRVLIDGASDHDPAWRARLGYMPQAARFPENLSGREVLRLIRDLRSPGTDIDEELVEEFGLASELDKPVRTLSGGTRQKLNAVVAFLFRPALLVLDEPTAGLDPIAAGQLKAKILRARAAGVTVLLTSHVLSEIEELVDEIVFLLDGRIRFQGPLSRLRELTGEQRLERAIAELMKRERSCVPR